MIFDHRLTFDHQGIRALLLKLAANFKRLNRLGKYFQRFACGNAAHNLNAIDLALILELNAATLFRFAINQPLFL